ncbi:Uncharacterised protein [Raoultella terrigena]|uniref:Uncharacterized protein n=1 Tax=Raoultella terrigena TaxID=577 RepID=A0A4U9D045_RAOTE|nr:Uncharacterised protein [Raoultella terrigena]
MRSPLRARRFAGNQFGLACGQQTGDFPRVLHRRGENHRPFSRLGKLNNLADDMRRNALLFFQLVIEVGLANRPLLCA